jgi:hypothetical protein
MKLNNNHLLLFAFAIAAGLYIWNDTYSGKRDTFYAKKAASRGMAIAVFVLFAIAIGMAFAYQATENELFIWGAIFSINAAAILVYLGGGPSQIMAAL